MRLAGVLLACVFLASAASAQLLPGAFLKSLLSDKPQLTKQQAQAVTGLWNTTRSRRLEGYTADLAALDAIDGGVGDAEAALQGAVNNRTVNSGVRGVRWIPAVDRESGIFTMYLVLFKDGEVLDVNRHMGAALGQADGSVLLTSTNSEDTGILTSLVKDDRMVSLWMEGLEVVDKSVTQPAADGFAWQFTGERSVLDNQAVAVFEYSKVDSAAEEEAVKQLVAADIRKKWQLGSAAAPAAAPGPAEGR